MKFTEERAEEDEGIEKKSESVGEKVQLGKDAIVPCDQ